MNDDEFRFELHRLADTSDEAILEEIRRVASLIEKPQFTATAFDKLSKVSRTTVTRRFGSWTKALEAASLSNRPQMSDSDILVALKKLSERLGKKQLTVREVESHLPISFHRLQRGWGSARAAFETAGLTVASVGHRYSDDDCFENLLDVWTHYGRPPTYREMSEPPSKVGGKAYTLRFGTWNKALSAFVHRANGGADQDVESTTSQTSAGRTPPRVVAPDDSPKRGPRDAPLSLRFKVLRRDNFRCVLCGDNPPKNPDCVLHVDHILPWSLGGATIAHNLRTLCATCNLGRSNRYAD